MLGSLGYSWTTFGAVKQLFQFLSKLNSPIFRFLGTRGRDPHERSMCTKTELSMHPMDSMFCSVTTSMNKQLRNRDYVVVYRFSNSFSIFLLMFILVKVRKNHFISWIEEIYFWKLKNYVQSFVFVWYRFHVSVIIWVREHVQDDSPTVNKKFTLTRIKNIFRS